MKNLTPHAIVVQTPAGEVVSFEPAGTVARVDQEQVVVDTCPVTGVHVKVDKTVGIVGIPEAGTEMFLVSAMVLAELGPEYSGWAFAPGTGPKDGAIRNEKGFIEAVTCLKTVVK